MIVLQNEQLHGGFRSSHVFCKAFPGFLAYQSPLLIIAATVDVPYIAGWSGGRVGGMARSHVGPRSTCVMVY